ncbi:hypothetical protein F2Q69_00048769 [Brassica cretica]|uniref:Uncharacterized protein n=1 Tax=Brassica cretica TaxID=69181 RepID=A0A8S9PW85_BRACR|nr:hypothetical protein F2Q69_00048769 [Brassica cretica]
MKIPRNISSELPRIGPSESPSKYPDEVLPQYIPRSFPTNWWSSEFPRKFVSSEFRRKILRDFRRKMNFRGVISEDLFRRVVLTTHLPCHVMWSRNKSLMPFSRIDLTGSGTPDKAPPPLRSRPPPDPPPFTIPPIPFESLTLTEPPEPPDPPDATFTFVLQVLDLESLASTMVLGTTSGVAPGVSTVENSLPLPPYVQLFLYVPASPTSLSSRLV